MRCWSAEQVECVKPDPVGVLCAANRGCARSPSWDVSSSLQAVVFGGEALEPQRLRTWLDNHPGLPRLINYVWHYRDDGACLVPGDRRR